MGCEGINKSVFCCWGDCCWVLWAVRKQGGCVVWNLWSGKAVFGSGGLCVCRGDEGLCGEAVVKECVGEQSLLRFGGCVVLE